MSLSARRAWIEIWNMAGHPHLLHVALRKESVDRNSVSLNAVSAPQRSLSARRAWIEIFISAQMDRDKQSLSARRAWIEICVKLWTWLNPMSLSARRAWIEIGT